jgi:hypothetical protein
MKLSIAMTIGAIAAGCAPHMSDADAKSARDLAAEQLICVDKAATREDSRECRCEAMKQHGRECPAGWDRP